MSVPGGPFGFNYVSIAFAEKGLRCSELPQNALHLDGFLKAADKGILAFTIT
jgi:hypothetical protein